MRQQRCEHGEMKGHDPNPPTREHCPGGVREEVTIDHIDDPVDQPLIAARLGVTRETVQKWRTREVLPLPDYPQLSTPVWDWETIRTWAEETGRIRE